MRGTFVILYEVQGPEFTQLEIQAPVLEFTVTRNATGGGITPYHLKYPARPGVPVDFLAVNATSPSESPLKGMPIDSTLEPF